MKGKEIIEYYLKQLEEEGITFVPRWTPPVACQLESSTSHTRRPVSPAITIPDSATKEGLSNKEILNTSSSPTEPTAGTPDGMLVRLSLVGCFVLCRLPALRCFLQAAENLHVGSLFGNMHRLSAGLQSSNVWDSLGYLSQPDLSK